jgi:hypothetical protein
MRNEDDAGVNSACISARRLYTSAMLLQPSASLKIFSSTRPIPGTRRVGMDWMKLLESEKVGAITVTPFGLFTSLHIELSAERGTGASCRGKTCISLR